MAESISEALILLFMVIGSVCFVHCLFYKRHLLSLQIKKVPLVLGIQICSILFAAAFIPPDHDDTPSQELLEQESKPYPEKLLYASIAGFVENSAFILPALMVPPSFKIPLLITSTIVFTSGHSYQGKRSMLAKTPFVGVAYLCSIRFGFLTTVVAHSIEDIFAETALEVYTNSQNQGFHPPLALPKK